MAKFGFKLEDTENGKIDVESFGDLNEDTPASWLAWGVIYLLNDPYAQAVLRRNVEAFRQSHLEAKETVDTTTDLG